jgi:hypothetical protein
MNKSSRLFAVVALTVAALAGCASPWTVDSFEAPEANVSTRSTYFIKGGDLGIPTGVDAGATASVDAAMRNTLKTDLARKGYTEVADAAAAQLLVSYQVAGTRKFVMEDDRRVGAPSPTRVLSPSEMQPPPLSSVPREQAMREGTVLVFVEDPATGMLLWRGMISAETRVGSTEGGIRTVADMAHHILQDFPARAGQAAK